MDILDMASLNMDPLCAKGF